MTAGASVLSSQVVLLSGATGAVGSALLQVLLAGGARIGIALRKPRHLPAMQDLPASRVLAGVVGATDAEAAAGFVKGVEDSLGPITAFVSTAGTFRGGPFAAEQTGTLAELLEANLLSAATLVRAVVPPMLRRRSGAVVLTGAAAAEQPAAGMAGYAASKAALHAWARGLAAELGTAGLRVTVVAPATIDTPANRAAMPAADPAAWTPLQRVVDALVGGITRRDAPDDPIRLL